MEIGTIAAFILAIAKAVPAVERIVGELSEGYRAWKTTANQADENKKDSAIDAAIAAARAAPLKLCDTCPFAGDGRGQRNPAPATPTIPPSSPSGS